MPDLWLAFAPVKKGRVDWLVEKAVELGVARLLPVVTQRTIVDKLNLERMRAHIVEAAEQCGRTALADIDEPVKLDPFLKDRDPARTLYFADETRRRAGREQRSAPGPALILTGPEGGFTPGRSRRDPRRAERQGDQPRPAHPSRRNRGAGRRRQPGWRAPGDWR